MNISLFAGLFLYNRVFHVFGWNSVGGLTSSEPDKSTLYSERLRYYIPPHCHLFALSCDVRSLKTKLHPEHWNPGSTKQRGGGGRDTGGQKGSVGGQVGVGWGRFGSVRMGSDRFGSLRMRKAGERALPFP